MLRLGERRVGVERCLSRTLGCYLVESEVCDVIYVGTLSRGLDRDIWTGKSWKRIQECEEDFVSQGWLAETSFR